MAVRGAREQRPSAETPTCRGLQPRCQAVGAGLMRARTLNCNPHCSALLYSASGHWGPDSSRPPAGPPAPPTTCRPQPLHPHLLPAQPSPPCPASALPTLRGTETSARWISNRRTCLFHAQQRLPLGQLDATSLRRLLQQRVHGQYWSRCRRQRGRASPAARCPTALPPLRSVSRWGPSPSRPRGSRRTARESAGPRPTG